MNGSRFEDLMSRLLDEEIDAAELAELIQSIKDSPERQRELQLQLEAAEMLAQSEDDLRRSSLFVATIDSRVDDDPFVLNALSAIAGKRDRQERSAEVASLRRARWPWAIAAAAVLALTVSVALLRSNKQQEIFRITAWNGSLEWTGDGGQVKQDLQAGTSLGGGTLELLSAESWAVLEFHDGSTVTVSGRSILTISERKQKEMHLREGSLSASVTPQPAGKPLLIHTPTAEVEVLGTQLNVEAEPSATVLSVNEGRVRVKRLADGKVTEVEADHQVVASAHRLTDFKAIRRPRAVGDWRSDLPADARYGQWQPARGTRPGSLRATPLLLKCNPKKPLLLFVTAFTVSSGSMPPVQLSSGARFRVRGRIESTATLYFGLTMNHRKGGFAGKYVASRQVDVHKKGGEDFDVELCLEELKPLEARFPATPTGLELADCWCLTANEDRGLSITSVALISSE